MFHLCSYPNNIFGICLGNKTHCPQNKSVVEASGAPRRGRTRNAVRTSPLGPRSAGHGARGTDRLLSPTPPAWSRRTAGRSRTRAPRRPRRRGPGRVPRTKASRACPRRRPAQPARRGLGPRGRTLRYVVFHRAIPCLHMYTVWLCRKNGPRPPGLLVAKTPAGDRGCGRGLLGAGAPALGVEHSAGLLGGVTNDSTKSTIV